MKENYLVKLLSLLITFLPSQTLFWKIVTVLFGENEIYITQQFLFACSFTIGSILLTEDIELFNSFWIKHPRGRIIFDKILHYSTVAFLSIPKAVMWILCIDRKNGKEEYIRYKQELQMKVEEYDNMSLLIRTLFPAGLLTIIWGSLLSFNILPINAQEWISEILSFFVSVIGFIFVVANIKKDL